MGKPAVEQLQNDFAAAMEKATLRLHEAIVVTAQIVAAGHALTGELFDIANKPIIRKTRKTSAIKTRKPRRKLSPAARKRISEAQKARWAKQKKAAK
jgi:hypothetical protein